MKKLTTLVIILLSFLAFRQMEAQPVFTLEDGLDISFGVPIIYHQANPANLDEGNSGPNQLWDYSELEDWGEDFRGVYLRPEDTPFPHLEQKANVALKFQYPDGFEFYSYARITEHAFQVLADAAEGFDPIIYTQPDEFVQYPVTFGDSYGYRSETKIAGAPWSSNETTTEVDGYGTLKLPQATFENVLRFHAQSRIVRADGFTIENDRYYFGTTDYYGELFQILYQTVYLEGQIIFQQKYAFWVPSAKVPIPSISGNIWNDSNRNGKKDRYERAFHESVDITLSKEIDGEMVQVATTTSDKDGNYHFNDLAQGQYQLRISYLSDNWTLTTSDAESMLNQRTLKSAVLDVRYKSMHLPIGVHRACINLDHGGQITESITIHAGDPMPLITNVQLPGGGSGQLDTYRWAQLDPESRFQNIIGVTVGPDFRPVRLSQGDNYFIRKARRRGCPVYMDSNIARVRVLPPVSNRSVAINDTHKSGLHNLIILPNPVEHEVTLEFVSGESSNVTIQLHSVDGQLVRSVERMMEKGVNRIQLSVSDLPTGIYTTSVKSGDQLYTKRLVKK
ncbi:MAG: SdrD B-like domain-containing protein [Bacteroidota bacterium]